jgi:general secretion pathway protein E
MSQTPNKDMATGSTLALSDARSEAFVSALSAELARRNLIDDMAMKRAVRAQRQSGERFDLVLTRLGLLPEATLAEVLGDLLGLAYVTASDFPLAPVLAAELDPGFLKRNRVLPLHADAERLVVAVADPFNTSTIDALAFLVEKPVERVIALGRDIDIGIDRLYGANSPVPAIDAHAAGGESASDDDVRRLHDLAAEAPVIRLVQDIIVRAVEAHASDIHVEPREDSLSVRLRIDGMLHTIERLPVSLRSAVTSRIKIMARLDIAERRLPQDGRIKASVAGRAIDLRVSTMPTLHGESVVLRILDRSQVKLELATLGFGERFRSDVGRLITQPNGIILVTGPTGSGKTTTLYTALGMLNTEPSKIFTVEDPIEYQLAGINQIQVQPRIGLTFATALRSILRQDPDVIMVGEIRDLETAEIAIQAALTGHLVLSTVHTNSAAATITRLLDMGVDDYLLASTIAGVVAQRLVRRLCDHCAEPAELSPLLVERLQAVSDRTQTAATTAVAARARRKKGCPACRQTGFSGRTVVSELLHMTAATRDAVLTKGTEHTIEAAAIGDGMCTMYQDGLGKALAGETTIDEVLRVTRIA